MFFRECPYCGCNLDPSEKCECRDQKQKKEDRLAELIESDQFGQMTMKVEVLKCRKLSY